MKQKTRLVALITDGKHLFLTKTPSGQFSLPICRAPHQKEPADRVIKFIEQSLQLKVSSENLRLIDLITISTKSEFGSSDLYAVYLMPIDSESALKSPAGYWEPWPLKLDLEPWADQLIDKIGFKELMDQVKPAHHEVDASPTEVEALSIVDQSSDGKTKIDYSRWSLFSDGGSRGNPGHSAAAYVLQNSDSEVIDQGGQYLGITTSAMAEYQGLRQGLERATKLGVTRLNCFLDSSMVVRHMTGDLTVKNRDLWPVYDYLQELAKSFDEIDFYFIPREKNSESDRVLNEILDQHLATF